MGDVVEFKPRVKPNVVDLSSEGYLVPLEDLVLPPNPYVTQSIVLLLEHRMGGEYIGWLLGLTNWVPEWHSYLHSKPKVDSSRVDRIGPIKYHHCTARDWLHLVE